MQPLKVPAPVPFDVECLYNVSRILLVAFAFDFVSYLSFSAPGLSFSATRFPDQRSVLLCVLVLLTRDDIDCENVRCSRKRWNLQDTKVALGCRLSAIAQDRVIRQRASLYITVMSWYVTCTRRSPHRIDSRCDPRAGYVKRLVNHTWRKQALDLST